MGIGDALVLDPDYSSREPIVANILVDDVSECKGRKLRLASILILCEAKFNHRCDICSMMLRLTCLEQPCYC